MNALPPISAPTVEIWQGDALRCLELLPSDTFDCVVTSPPYWGLRDYGVEGQIGLEPTMAAYLATMIGVCRELRRVLKPSGTFWLNIGDSYSGSWGAQGRRITESDDPSWHGSQIKNHPRFASGTGSSKRSGLKQKDLCMIPNRLAIALQDDGWWVRSEIIWAKPNPMPESVTDRPTSSHEKIWLLTKSERYYFDAAAIAEPSVAGHGSGNGFKRDARLSYADAGGARGSDKPWVVSGTRKALRGATESRHRASVPGGQSLQAEPTATRNARNVWAISTKPFKGAHFATFPPDLAERCIKAGCPPSGRVLDPFGGAGTTGLVAQRLGRSALLIELNEAYCEMARRRIEAAV